MSGIVATSTSNSVGQEGRWGVGVGADVDVGKPEQRVLCLEPRTLAFPVVSSGSLRGCGLVGSVGWEDEHCLTGERG